MLPFTDIPLGTLVLGLVILCLIYMLYFRGRAYSPPIPPSIGWRLPIIGHMHRIEWDTRKCMKRFREECGDVYSMYWGSKLMVVIAGFDAMKEGFKTKGDQFPLRPDMPLLSRVSRHMGIASANGPGWREHRRFALSTLKDFGMGKSKLEGKIHAEARVLLEEIGGHGSEPFNPKPLICTHVANIICSMSFGMNFTYDDPRFVNMMRKFEQNLDTFGFLANFIPWLENIPGDPLKVGNMIENSDKIFEYCHDIIKEHIDTYDESHVHDLTSAYIREMKRIEKSGEESTMSYEYLASVIADLFIAGSETTATTIRWALAALVNFPDIQERIHQEIQDHVGTSRLPSIQDKSSMKYLEAFYMEVLRYCNLVSLGLFHAPQTELVFRGFTIPADAIIVPDLVSVSRDPTVWTEPDVFNPDRFLDDKGNLMKRDEDLAFFTGKRSCLGESLARMELFLFLSCLIQKFKFESPPGEDLTIDGVDGTFGIVHAPKIYKIVAKPRI